MNSLKLITMLLASAALGACSTTTSTTTITTTTGGGGTTFNPGGATVTDINGLRATHTGAVYSATQAGTLTAISGTPSSLNGQPFWFNLGAQTAISGYENTNVLAIGGFNNNSLIRGVSGVATTTPLIGNASYLGRYSENTTHSTSSGILTVGVNFGAGTFASTAGAASVSGTVSGTTFSGTYSRNGVSAPLNGGFFGTNEMVGAFGNTSIAGVIYGTKQ